MLRRTGALVVLLLALATTRAPADPYTAAFDALRTAATARIAELAGTLTPAQAKEKAVLDKIAAALATPSSGLAGDLKIATKLAAQVKKAALGQSALPSLLLDALSGLSTEVSALLKALRDRLTDIPDAALRQKVGAAIDRIAARLDAAGSLSNAAKFANVLKGRTADAAKIEKRVARAEAQHHVVPCVKGADTFSATIDGAPWSAQAVTGTIIVNPSDSVLSVIVNGLADADAPFGERFEVGITAGTYTGPGDYVVDRSNVDPRYHGPGNSTFASQSGTITIELVDVAKRRITGSVDFYGAPLFQTSPLVHYTAQFDVSCAKLVRP